MLTILLTGATGYRTATGKCSSGERQHLPRLLVRNAKKLTAKTSQHAEIVDRDTFQLAFLQQALNGIDTATYLIHSMSSGCDFSKSDRTLAENFTIPAWHKAFEKLYT